jgi:hypothetical protein
MCNSDHLLGRRSIIEGVQRASRVALALALLSTSSTRVRTLLQRHVTERTSLRAGHRRCRGRIDGRAEGLCAAGCRSADRDECDRRRCTAESDALRQQHKREDQEGTLLQMIRARAHRCTRAVWSERVRARRRAVQTMHEGDAHPRLCMLAYIALSLRPLCARICAASACRTSPAALSSRACAVRRMS